MSKEITLSRGMVTLVDDEDYEWLSQWKWHVVMGSKNRNKPYAARNRNARDHGTFSTLMHRQILSLPDGMQVDHINGDTLDNRRANLRAATPAQNASNIRSHKDSSSQYLGVFWVKRLKKWQTQIHTNKRTTHLGLFLSEEEAAHTHDVAARERFGEFAHLNFPEPAEACADELAMDAVESGMVGEADVQHLAADLIESGLARGVVMVRS